VPVAASPRHCDEASRARCDAVLHGRDTVALAETCRALEKSGAKTAKLIHDLATFAASRPGRRGRTQAIDLLVNNAGIAVVKPLPNHASGMEQTIGGKRNAPFS